MFTPRAQMLSRSSGVASRAVASQVSPAIVTLACGYALRL